MEYTRKQRLNDDCTHREYYAQFINKNTKQTVLHHIGLDRILASTDDAMNDIELNSWDVLPQISQETWRKMESLGDNMSMAGKVCIYKEAAKQIKEEHSRSDPE